MHPIMLYISSNSLNHPVVYEPCSYKGSMTPGKPSPNHESIKLIFKHNLPNHDVGQSFDMQKHSSLYQTTKF